MTAIRADSGRRRFAWHVGAATMIVLSIVAALAGWVVTLFDDQYETSAVAGRAFIGIFAGAFSALLAAPFAALVSLIVAIIASFCRRVR